MASSEGGGRGRGVESDPGGMEEPVDVVTTEEVEDSGDDYQMAGSNGAPNAMHDLFAATQAVSPVGEMSVSRFVTCSWVGMKAEGTGREFVCSKNAPDSSSAVAGRSQVRRGHDERCARRSVMAATSTPPIRTASAARDVSGVVSANRTAMRVFTRIPGLERLVSCVSSCSNFRVP